MLKPLALLPFLALPAFAQQADPGIVPPAIPFRAPNFIHPGPVVVLRQPGSCPIGISAQPQGIPQSVWVASAEDAALPLNGRARTGVHVRLASISAHPMTHLTVTVTYRDYADGTLMQVRTHPPVPRQKTFELQAEDASVLERNLLVGGSVEILRVRILHVDYTNGSEWQSSEYAGCSVKPSHLVLTATR